MSEKSTGQRALVTAAGAGIGRAIARGLATSCMKVAVVSEEATYITGQILGIDGGWTAYGYV